MSGDYGESYGNYGETYGETYGNYGETSATTYPPTSNYQGTTDGESSSGNESESSGESSEETGSNYVQLVGGSGVHEGNLFVNETLICLDDQQGLEVAQVVCRCISSHLI